MMIRLLYFVIKYFPRTKFINKIQRILYVKQLSRVDGSLADVEIAKDLGVKVGRDCRFYGPDFGFEPFLIEIGDNVIISGRVQFITHDGAVQIFRKEIPNIVNRYGKIKIGNNCFIGFGTIILPNVQLGTNCIVAAGSVVADSFPDDSVIIGNPAKVIFKTSLYKKLSLSSRLTLFDSVCSFPEFNYQPYEFRKKFILDRIGHIPIRKPKKKGGQQGFC